MPELPEVETIVNTLKRFITNKEIADISVYWPNIIKLPDDIEQFKFKLIGQTFHDITRKGKFLLFELDDYILVSHLRMEGKYNVYEKGIEKDKHTHVIFQFTDGEEMHYNDVRKFGTMHLFTKGEELNEKPLKQLAPDPFEADFTLEYLFAKLQKTRRAIKAVLLDQTVVAGLGNIYVDEVLFKTQTHPLKKANELTKAEVQLIKKESIIVLDQAIKQGGTTIRSYTNSAGEMGMFQQELFVYGQENEPCKTCEHPIEKMKVAGRGTHICPRCQTL